MGYLKKACIVFLETAIVFENCEQPSTRGLRLIEVYDNYVVGDLIKVFFRNLKEPLIDPRSCKQLLEALQSNVDESVVNDAFQKTLNHMDKKRKHVLNCVIRHLIKVDENSMTNRMCVTNLASIWADTLTRYEDPDVRIAPQITPESFNAIEPSLEMLSAVTLSQKLREVITKLITMTKQQTISFY
ncbi:hypothetical protein Ciccas_010755 [Cichlidogyrus casuarinus]|uniref:Rho-GAP domain-containing protein n=1 Tax=Cichlidogyrus casuarinus TaxID=1844966 RepID=A0ABD2PTT0_9PLAT